PARGGLEFVEQRVEAPVVLFEGLAAALDPVHGLFQSPRLQFAWAPLRVDAHGDEAGALEHFQMLGDGGLAQFERFGEFGHGGFARRQPRQDGAASTAWSRCAARSRPRRSSMPQRGSHAISRALPTWTPAA